MVATKGRRKAMRDAGMRDVRRDSFLLTLGFGVLVHRALVRFDVEYDDNELAVWSWTSSLVFFFGSCEGSDVFEDAGEGHGF